VDRDTRNAIERATQRARTLLQDDFATQLEGAFDIWRSGAVSSKGGPHLSRRQSLQREKIVAAIDHKRATGLTPPEAVADYLRDAAFTILNRFVALKMLEARGLVLECISKGEQSSGYREFSGMAPGVALLPDSTGYRLYVESLFDELSTEIKVLFDRRDPAAVLWPKRATFDSLLDVLNTSELSGVWSADETIGWVYQFFNSSEERKRMRDESPAPRNSRELAVRNQFFTPRYVVEFLVDNTLARLWIEMIGEGTVLRDRCPYFVRSEGEQLGRRPQKDPRDLRLLDPACGSGHFLLYCFDLLLAIYEEAWGCESREVRSQATGRTLREDYPELADLRRAAPALIIEHNLYGVDIDPRAAQIAPLALWLRAQRAWNDAGISASSRPRVSRTHIVVAEPMPGDATLVNEFSAQLQPPLLQALFRNLVSEMRLAGELGALIPVEEGIAAALRRARDQFAKQTQTTGYLPGMEPARVQGELDISGIDDDSFFHEAEVRIVEALRAFAETATSEAVTRRRLFAGDSAQGIALVDLLRTRFDVVLMNPPFGEPTIGAQPHIAKAFPSGANDIYAAFVLRFSELLVENGFLGAITSRSFFVGRDLRSFRKHILESSSASLNVVLDLGLGVLDAMVETAAYVLGPSADGCARFLDLRGTEKASAAIGSALSSAAWKTIERDHFLRLPQGQLLYDLSNEDVGALASCTQIEPIVGRVTKGLSTGDDGRFVRLRWEVRGNASENANWELFSKGGEYGWFGSDVHLVIKRHSGGAELAAHAERTHGNVALSRQSSTYYGRTAVTWSRRSQKGFSARRLRPGVCFSDKSPVIIPAEGVESWIAILLAVLATDKYLGFIYAQSKFGSYETGSVKTLPVPEAEASRDIPQVMRRLFLAFDEIDARDELCQLFSCLPESGWEPTEHLRTALADLANTLDTHGLTLADEVVRHTLDVGRQRFEQITSPMASVSRSLGVALGRWDPLVAGQGALPGPLDELPWLSVRETVASPQVKLPEWLADDEGSTSDVVAAVTRVLSDQGVGDLQPGTDLRATIRRDLFSWHLLQYSKSARKAPVYWQLASRTSKYSVWVFYHRLNRDSLFKLQNEVVIPKLRHEEKKLTEMLNSSGASANSTQRKEVATQEALVAELVAFLDDVKSVAPVWDPDFDDGVLLNASPLWRLFPQHRAWQRELRAAWDALCAGELDWSIIAMRFWPERVVPKCMVDRSLAIAHGLESVFWELADDGKWHIRSKPTRSVEDLVLERTLPAVKAALPSLTVGLVNGSLAAKADSGVAR
jgi:hypothetical protein